jgi:RNA recognition motif-containing protein
MAPKKDTKKVEKEEKPAPKAKAPAAKAPAGKAAPAKQAKAAEAPAAAKSSGTQRAGVFIKDLDFEGMSHETVKELFKHCGKIREVRLRHGKYVLVFFVEQAAAQKAAEMNGKTLKGNKVTIELLKRANPTPEKADAATTIYVGNLPGGTTKKQLSDHFHSAGKIIKVRVYNPRHFGFVYYADNASAKKALELAEVLFAHGKDVSKVQVRSENQFKLELKLSIRSRELDQKKATKRYNRAPPSGLLKREKKTALRVKNRAAKKKSDAKKQEQKKEDEKKGSTNKKGSTTNKKGSTTNKKGSTTNKKGSTTNKKK